MGGLAPGKAEVRERSDRIGMIMAKESIMLESVESRGSGDLDDYWRGDGKSPPDL